MKPLAIIAAAALVGTLSLGLSGCAEENRSSIVVEHFKQQPAPPSCGSAVGDPFVTGGLIDLSLASGAGTGFGATALIRNQLLAREDYNAMRAESNHIVIEGGVVDVFAPDGSLLVENLAFEAYNLIEAESSGLAPAIILPFDTVAQLASDLECEEFFPENYPAPWDFGMTDVNGNSVSRTFGQVLAVVTFMGETLGNQELETPEQVFTVALCCGCLVNWFDCINFCSAVCGDEPEAAEWCNTGVGYPGLDGEDCRLLYHDANDPRCATDCVP